MELMLTARADIMEVPPTLTDRYLMAVWMDGEREAITFPVASPAKAAANLIWIAGDPRVAQIVTTDTFTGRNLTVWTR